MEKDRLSTRVDAELLKAFKMEVVKRNGRLHGAMAQEVEEALKLWLGNPWTKKKK